MRSAFGTSSTQDDPNAKRILVRLAESHFGGHQKDDQPAHPVPNPILTHDAKVGSDLIICIPLSHAHREPCTELDGIPSGFRGSRCR